MCNSPPEKRAEYSLQRTQHQAAHVVTETGKYAHITRVLLGLQWLPVEIHIMHDTRSYCRFSAVSVTRLLPVSLTSLPYIVQTVLCCTPVVFSSPCPARELYGVTDGAFSSPQLWNSYSYPPRTHHLFWLLRKTFKRKRTCFAAPMNIFHFVLEGEGTVLLWDI